VEFFHKNEYERSYSIYKHDTTLKMTFGANFFLDVFNCGPPISVLSRLSFTAQDNQDKKRKLDFMDAISKLSLALGDTSDYGYKRQLMSSSCFQDGPIFDFEEVEEGKIDQDLMSDHNVEDEDRPDFPEQSRKQPSRMIHPQLPRVKSLPSLTTTTRALRSEKTKIADASIALRRVKRKTQSGSNQSNLGSIFVQAKMLGCRFECDKKLPEPTRYSKTLPFEVSTLK
jgi:hypothetical protein